MSTRVDVPGPRSAMDEGTVHDLALDGAQIVLDFGTGGLPQTPTRPAPVVDETDQADAPTVPDDAPHLLSGLSQYGC